MNNGVARQVCRVSQNTTGNEMIENSKRVEKNLMERLKEDTSVQTPHGHNLTDFVTF